MNKLPETNFKYHNINYRKNEIPVWKNYGYWFTSTNLYIGRKPKLDAVGKKKKRDGIKGSKKGKGKLKLSVKSSRLLCNRIGNFKGFFYSSNKKDSIIFQTLIVPGCNTSLSNKQFLLNKLSIALNADYYISKSELQPSTSYLHYHILAANGNEISLSFWFKWLRLINYVPNRYISSLADAHKLCHCKKVTKKELNAVCNYLSKNPTRSDKNKNKIYGHQWSSSINLKFGPLKTYIDIIELQNLMNGQRKVYSITDDNGKNIGTTLCNTPITLDMFHYYKLNRYGQEV